MDDRYTQFPTRGLERALAGQFLKCLHYITAKSDSYISSLWCSTIAADWGAGDFLGPKQVFTLTFTTVQGAAQVVKTLKIRC